MLPVGVVQSVSSPQVDSDKAQSHRLKSSAEATGGSDNGITNLESAGALLQQGERVLFIGTQFSILYTFMYSPA